MELNRSERRSWRLHRQLSTHLTRSTLEEWRPRIEGNLQRLRDNVSGQPHLRNLDRWESLINASDVPGLHCVLTGLDRDSIEMREVSPMSGLLSQEERLRELLSLGERGGESTPFDFDRFLARKREGESSGP